MTSGSGDDRWGRFVGTGRNGLGVRGRQPLDGTLQRFRFEPNYNVGLILFDQVLAFKTARAANIAEDPSLVQRPNPGVEQLPSNGGIFGATYVYPDAGVPPGATARPQAGALIAATTADFVDPVRSEPRGLFVNYDGGDREKPRPRARARRRRRVSARARLRAHPRARRTGRRLVPGQRLRQPERRAHGQPIPRHGPAGAQY